MRLVEPFAVIDIFTCGLARVELLRGGNVRFTHFAEQIAEDGNLERVVVSKLIMPMESIAEARRLTNLALTAAIRGEKPEAIAVLAH